MTFSAPIPTVMANETLAPGCVATQYFFSFHAHSAQPSFAEGTSRCAGRTAVVDRHKGRKGGVRVLRSNLALRSSFGRQRVSFACVCKARSVSALYRPVSGWSPDRLAGKRWKS